MKEAGVELWFYLMEGGLFFFYYHSWTIAMNDTKDDSDIGEQKKMDLWVQFIILMQMKFSIITTFCQTWSLNWNKIMNGVWIIWINSPVCVIPGSQ